MEIKLNKNIDTLKMKFEIHKGWRDIEGEPCKQLIYKGYFAEVGATECCYYGSVTHPNKTEVMAPPEFKTQQEIENWCEEHIFNSALVREIDSSPGVYGDERNHVSV